MCLHYSSHAAKVHTKASLNKPPTTNLIALTFMDAVCKSGWGTNRSVSGGACTASKVLPKTGKVYITSMASTRTLFLSSPAKLGILCKSSWVTNASIIKLRKTADINLYL